MNTSLASARLFFGALFFLFWCVNPSTMAAIEDWAAPLHDAQAALAEERYEDAFPAFLQQAKQENGLAQFNVALFFDLGWGREADRGKACHWYLKAASNNIPASLSAAGDCVIQGYLEGKGPQDAFDLYLEAYRQNLFSAGCRAGMLLIEGKLGAGRISEGVTLCMQAAEQGAIEPALKMAKWHFYGQHVKQNYPLALALFQRARPDMQPEAAFYIARFFDEGLHIQQDNQQAAYWYEVAAEQGWQAAYLPCAALYWANFLSAADNREIFLAKAYMWGQASEVTAQDENLESARLLNATIQQVMPTEWTTSLDQKVDAHLRKFTAPAGSSD